VKSAKIQMSNAQDKINEKLENMGDFAPTIHFIPRVTDKYELNDI